MSTNPQVQNDPVYEIPFLYLNGLQLSWGSNTTLSIASGQCRDSNDNIDIVLGNPNYAGITTTAPLTLNAAVNGVNGLDTGTFAEASVYTVYLIADSRYLNATACLLSLASNASPTMPYGYDSYRAIGYGVTNSSSAHFLLFYVTGNGSGKLFTFDAPQATSVTTGAATSYTQVELTTLIPPVNNSLVYLQTNFNANAAGDTLKMQGYSSTGDAITIIAPVAGSTAHTQTYSRVLAQLDSSNNPSINYKVSSSSDSVAIDVTGFEFNL